MRLFQLTTLGMLMAFAATAHAVTLNFDSHASTGAVGGTPPAAAVVNTEYASLGIVFGRAGVSAGSAVVNNSSANSLPNGLCGLDLAGDIVFACAGDQYFHFVNPSDGTTASTTNSLSFVIGDSGGDPDSWIVHVYNLADVELEARVVASPSNILQSFNHAGMHRVWIQFTNNTTAGYLLDDINFNSPQGGPVPEPATIFLLGLGLLGIALDRKGIR